MEGLWKFQRSGDEGQTARRPVGVRDGGAQAGQSRTFGQRAAGERGQVTQYISISMLSLFSIIHYSMSLFNPSSPSPSIPLGLTSHLSHHTLSHPPLHALIRPCVNSLLYPQPASILQFSNPSSSPRSHSSTHSGPWQVCLVAWRRHSVRRGGTAERDRSEAWDHR